MVIIVGFTNDMNTGEKVESGLEESGAYGPCDVVTDKGNTFHGDVVFRCTGLKVNSGAYQSLGQSTNHVLVYKIIFSWDGMLHYYQLN